MLSPPTCENGNSVSSTRPGCTSLSIGSIGLEMGAEVPQQSSSVNTDTSAVGERSVPPTAPPIPSEYGAPPPLYPQVTGVEEGPGEHVPPGVEGRASPLTVAPTTENSMPPVTQSNNKNPYSSPPPAPPASGQRAVNGMQPATSVFVGAPGGAPQEADTVSGKVVLLYGFLIGLFLVCSKRPQPLTLC